MVRTPKQEKEAFYRGHSGSTHTEVAGLVLCLPLFIILGEVLKGCLQFLPHSFTHQPAREWTSIVIEVLSVVMPQVLLYMGSLPPVATCVTLFVLLAALACARMFQPLHTSSPKDSYAQLASMDLDKAGHAQQAKQQYRQTGNSEQQFAARASLAQPQLNMARGYTADEIDTLEALHNVTSHRSRYISAYRGVLMLGTCVCILAVDFRAFPRRYAKTEAWGTSLMDGGVGGIILASSLGARSQVPVTGTHDSVVVRVGQALWAAAPCWALWGLRLVSVRAIDYQEAEGEYGVHWNFFATVACLTLLRKLLAAPHALMPTLTVAACAMHQAALSAGLGDWARQPSRDPSSLLSLNKEGLVSLPGYWAIALAGNTLGVALRSSFAHPCEEVAARLLASREAHDAAHAAPYRRWQALEPVLPVMGAWILIDMGLWVLALALQMSVEPVCRRCANLTYIVWLCALSVAVLLVLLAGQLLLPGGLRPVLPTAASTHMLPLFLAANLMTGAVNMSVDTLQVQDHTARAILLAYAGLLCVIAVMLAKYRVTF